MRQFESDSVVEKMDNELLREDPLTCPQEELEGQYETEEMECMKKNWEQIRSHIIRGKFSDIYHIRITDKMDIPQLLRAIFREQKTAFKINLAFGFVLRNINTGEIRYYYPSQNGYMFDNPVLIQNEEELGELIKSMAARDWMEEIRQQKPNTQWRVVTVCCVGIYVFKVVHVPIGRGGEDDILRESRIGCFGKVCLVWKTV